VSLSSVSKRDALQVVVPTQFVLFNLSAITGSAILYGDFKTAKFHQFVTFIYGCAATFAGVWIIAWPASEKPSTGPDDRVGPTSDVETMAHGVFVPDSVSVGGVVGRKPGNVPVLRSRQSTVSLVGISPAQVQSSIYLFKPITLICFYSAYYWYTHHLGLRSISDKNMESHGMGEKALMGAWEGVVPSPG
jgi:hypothetical protein